MYQRVSFFLPFRAVILLMAMLVGAAISVQAQPAITHAPQRNNAHLSLSPVIIAERPDAVSGYGSVDAQQVKQMVNRCLMVLTSSTDIGTAWTRLGITPQDIVGIKISTLSGPSLCTHPALIKAICDGLQAAGVPRSRIIIWDKFPDKMTPAGYGPRAASDQQPAIESIIPGNYDPNEYYSSGIVGGLIWGDYQFNNSLNTMTFDNDLLRRTYYAGFLTSLCTKIINVPILTHNETYGVEGCISSIAIGSTDNNRRFQGPPTFGDPDIDMIYDQSFIRRKIVVHILDALVAQCAGSPDFNPMYCRTFGAIYVGRDPVAIDSLALPRLERMRRELNVPSYAHMSTYLTSASVLGLGTTDRHRIQFLRVP